MSWPLAAAAAAVLLLTGFGGWLETRRWRRYERERRER